MDKNRLKSLCDKILKKKNVKIHDINCVRTFSVNDEGKWVENSYCVFLTIEDMNEQMYVRSVIPSLLESIFGIEFIVENF